MVVDLISGVLAEVCYRKVRINEGGITELSSSRPCKFRGEDFFLCNRKLLSYLHKNLPGEHTAACNEYVANSDRRRRESNAFVK